jgi:hypothetical protein
VDGEVLEFAVAEGGAEFFDGPPGPAEPVGGDVGGVEAFGAEVVDDGGLHDRGGDEDAFGLEVAGPGGRARAGVDDRLVGGPQLGVGGHAAVSFGSSVWRPVRAPWTAAQRRHGSSKWIGPEPRAHAF